MSEADLYKSAKISNDAFFIQWQEADGTFVALTFNLKTMKVVSTGIYKNYKWFRSGEVVDDKKPIIRVFEPHMLKTTTHRSRKL